MSKENEFSMVERGSSDGSGSEPSLPKETITFPDGGTQAWLALFGAFLLQYTSFGYSNSFGVYQDFYVREYLTNFSPSKIGWIGGTQLFFTFTTGVVSGRIFDQGHFRALIGVGTLLHAVALYTLSLTHMNSFYQVFLAQGLCLGISGGLIFIPSLAIIGHYFQKRRPLGLGVASAGSALGAILHPIMLNRLLTTTNLGFRNTVRVSATLNVVLLLVALAITRPRLPPKPYRRFPIGQWVRDPGYFWLLIASIFIFLSLFYPIFYIQLLSITRGVPKTLSFYTISILNASSFLGRIIPAALAPVLGVMNMEFTSFIAAGIVICFMSLVNDAVGAVMIAIFVGFFSGAGIGLVAPGIGAFSADSNELGTRLGLVYAIGGILGLFATPLSGALLTKQFHWLNASVFSGVCMIVAGIFIGVSRFCYVRSRKITTWVV